MLQKVIRVGNSAAVTIPREFAKKYNINSGDQVEVRLVANKPVLEIFPKEKIAKSYISGEFVGKTKAFVKKNKKLLEKLADA